MSRFARWLVIAVLSASPLVVEGQTLKKFYIAMDDHTDYMWTANVDQYRAAFLQMLDYYLDLADATSGNASAFQSRFACDGSYWLWTYEKNKSQADFDRLIGRLKDGHISAPMTLLTLCYGGMPAEAVLRSLYYAGSLERRYGLKFKLAMAQENQTLPYGLGALWAGAGASYSWKGICGCASRTPNVRDRPHDMYWWSGPDGSRILMKWYSQIGQDPYGIGGYAEARQIPGIISDADGSAAFRLRVPYDIVGLFGYGGDNLATNSEAGIQAAQQMTTASRKVIVSNVVDFFEDFEKTYGAALPAYGASFGNEWDNLSASLAEVSGGVKRTVEKLRAAEALAALVSRQDPGFMAGREDARDRAWIDLGMYFEHAWTADGPISRAARAAWERDRAAGFRGYVDTLMNDADAALGAMIRKEGLLARVFVFNPLSWKRTDYADYPYAGPEPVYVQDLAAGIETPCQFVTLKGIRYLRIWARDVPSLGYKVFEIIPGSGTLVGGGPTVSGNILENALIRLTLADNGAISSLQDKRFGGREFGRTIGGLRLNELGPGGGALSVENVGAVSATLAAVSSAPLSHTTSVTLFRDSERVDVGNEITQSFSTVAGWNFGINVDSPEVRHEEIGAVIRARTLDQGGAYSPRSARVDWLTLNHFADMSDGGFGLTLSASDNSFFKLGDSTTDALDTVTPKLTVLAGGQIDGSSLGLPDQGGDSYFLQRFGLRTHAAYAEGEAMRFALEHQNPFVAGTVTGGTIFPESIYSLLEIDNPDVVAWSVKPAEDTASNRLVIRLWNVSQAPAAATVRMGDQAILEARQISHIETPIGPLSPQGRALALSFEAQQWKTCSLTLDGSPGDFLLTSPSDGASIPAGATTTALYWAASTRAASYDVFFGTTTPPPFLMNTTGLSAAFAVAQGTAYYWNVVARNSAGSTPSGNGPRHFRVAAKSKGDLVGTWDVQGVYFRNSTTGVWTNLATPADLIACGDLYGDGVDDLIGIWPSQAGVWIKNSANGNWAFLGSTPGHIAAADMNGDGRADLLGTWDGQGVFYRDSISGSWIQMATPATLITAGDLDGDGKADLIGIWPGRAGVWVKYSLTENWSYLGSALRDLAVGDMNGDGREDLVGTWDGQGVFYRDSISGNWVMLATPADQIAAGDLDGDGTDDLIGIWSGQAGVWVKYSATGNWAYIGSSAHDIAAGKMVGGVWGAGLSKPTPLNGPVGGFPDGPSRLTKYDDLSSRSPGGNRFLFVPGRDLVPRLAKSGGTRIPGPGEPGFRSVLQKNIRPHGEKSK